MIININAKANCGFGGGVGKSSCSAMFSLDLGEDDSLLGPYSCSIECNSGYYACCGLMGCSCERDIPYQ